MSLFFLLLVVVLFEMENGEGGLKKNTTSMLLETGTNFTILDTEVAFFFLCHGVHMLLDCPEAIAFNFVLLLGHMLLPEKRYTPHFNAANLYPR